MNYIERQLGAWSENETVRERVFDRFGLESILLLD